MHRNLDLNDSQRVPKSDHLWMLLWENWQQLQNLRENKELNNYYKSKNETRQYSMTPKWIPMAKQLESK